MDRAARTGLAICGAIAVLGGGLAGIGLGDYAQTGAFAFYKQTPPPIAPSATTASTETDSYYPLSRAAPAPAYPENPAPPRPLTIARPAVPADYARAAQLATEDDPPAPPRIEAASTREDAAPVIPVQRGSWSAPGESLPAAAQGIASDATS